MKYQVITLKKGYAVQNTLTYAIVQTYNTMHEAQYSCYKLNDIKAIKDFKENTETNLDRFEYYRSLKEFGE